MEACTSGLKVVATLKADLDAAGLASLGTGRELLIEMGVVQHGDRAGLLSHFRLRILLAEVDLFDGNTTRRFHPLFE